MNHNILYLRKKKTETKSDFVYKIYRHTIVTPLSGRRTPCMLVRPERLLHRTRSRWFIRIMKNYPQSSDRVWHVRLPPINSDNYCPPPPPPKFCHWPDFPSDFSPEPPIRRAMGRRLWQISDFLNAHGISKAEITQWLLQHLVDWFARTSL